MIYSFDDFRLDTSTHELSHSKGPVAVEPQTFALLETLVANSNTVLTKEDLTDAVWQGRFTSDAAIASCIKHARQALGDDGKQQRYIKTIHGIGYRFVGTLTARSGRAGSLAEDSFSPEAGATQDSRPMLLVTPLEDFCSAGHVITGGLSHDITVGLSRQRWIKVISWASAQRLQTLASESLRPLTAADYCMAGQVMASGGRYSLAVELTDLRDHSVIWAGCIESRTGDINDLRTAVVEQAISTLELQLSAAEAARAHGLAPTSLDAWSHYHLGLQHMYRFNAEDNAAATACFERAIKLQADFSRAHAGLSFAHFQTAFNRYPGYGEVKAISGAIKSAEKAVELDALDPMANFVMGRSFWLDGDVDAGQPWLERALQINGNFAQAHYAHALASLMVGDAQALQADSHTEANAAIALSPLDPFMYGFYGVRALSFLRDGNLEKASFWANRAARQPNAIAAMDFIAAAVNARAGNDEAALTWAQRARKRSGGGDSTYFFRALPFYEGQLRQSLDDAFQDTGLAPPR
ncbi:MAG: winged helix-turn-helix domain-containing protein [Pseudomonadota bacterium]